MSSGSMVAPVAPVIQEMYERLETDAGIDDFHVMSDGWKLHSESWTSPSPTAVLLFSHGWMESTRSLGVRRLAHACKRRNIILVTFDTHGHGLSLEKSGVKMPEKKRGCIESLDVCCTHLAEMTSIAVKEYRLPLVVMAHSLTASALVFSTRRIVEAAKASGGQVVCTVYLAPPPPGLAPSCCPESCFIHCLPALCFYCVCSAPKDITPGLNPDQVLGENRNATNLYISNLLPNMCLGPHGYEGTRARSGANQMAAELLELDAGVPGRIFSGTKDTDTVSTKRLANFRQGPVTLSVEEIDGAIHDMLSTDPQALANIDSIFAYIDAQLEAIKV